MVSRNESSDIDDISGVLITGKLHGLWPSWGLEKSSLLCEKIDLELLFLIGDSVDEVKIESVAQILRESAFFPKWENVFEYLSWRNSVFFDIGLYITSRYVLKWRFEIFFLESILDLSCETGEIMEFMDSLGNIISLMAWKKESKRRIHHTYKHGGKKFILIQESLTFITLLKNSIKQIFTLLRKIAILDVTNTTQGCYIEFTSSFRILIGWISCKYPAKSFLDTNGISVDTNLLSGVCRQIAMECKPNSWLESVCLVDDERLSISHGLGHRTKNELSRHRALIDSTNRFTTLFEFFLLLSLAIFPIFDKGSGNFVLKLNPQVWIGRYLGHEYSINFSNFS
jgi:hypothetical protein